MFDFTFFLTDSHAIMLALALIAALAVDEDKRAQRHAAPIALVESQDCAVVIGVLAPDIFQEKQKPQCVLNRAPGEL